MIIKIKVTKKQYNKIREDAKRINGRTSVQSHCRYIVLSEAGEY